MTAAALDARGVAGLRVRLERELDDGALPSCQAALALDGEVRFAATLGRAAPESRFPIYSVTKALTAGAVWVLLGDGSLAVETRVADVIPEFATNGKESVRVEHLLTHTAGFPRAPIRPLEGADPAQRIARFRQWRLDWEPGTRFEYHPTSAHWVLAELIARVSGVDHRRFVSERVTGPLSLRRLQLGVRPADAQDVVDAVAVGDPDPESERMLERLENGPSLMRDLGQEHLLRFNDPAVREAGVPGAGAIGDAADVARYFQAILHGDAVWDPAVLEAGTRTIRTRFPDPWTSVPSNRTLGLAVAGDDGNAALRGFGEGVGPRAFGATGIGGQVAWADPDSGLSFCYLTNGLDVDPVRAFRRQVRLSAAAAACAPPARR